MKALNQYEDNFIERKLEGEPDRGLRQTVVALANSVPEGRLGILFVGVTNDSGEIKGVGNPDGFQKKIRRTCEEDCYPPIKYSTEVLHVDGKAIVAVMIPASSEKPHFAGPSYLRVGSESKAASKQQLEDLILSRTSKTRELVRLRDSGQVVTALALGCRLQIEQPISDSTFRESAPCLVTGCNAHYVTLKNLNDSTDFSKPIGKIELSFDHNNHRPMIIVSTITASTH